MARKAEHQGRVMLSHIHGSRYFEPVEYDGPIYLEPAVSTVDCGVPSWDAAWFNASVDSLPPNVVDCVATAPEGTPVTLVLGGFAIEAKFGPNPIIVRERRRR